MRRARDFKRRALARSQRAQLPAPAQPVRAPGFDTRVLFLRFFGERQQHGRVLLKVGGAGDEGAQALHLVGRVGREVGQVCYFALEEVGHDDERVGQVRDEAVGALEGRGVQAEDVVDADQGTGGCCGAGYV